MLGLKLNYVSKRGPRCHGRAAKLCLCSFGFLILSWFSVSSLVTTAKYRSSQCFATDTGYIHTYIYIYIYIYTWLLLRICLETIITDIHLYSPCVIWLPLCDRSTTWAVSNEYILNKIWNKVQFLNYSKIINGVHIIIVVIYNPCGLHEVIQ